MHFFWCWLFITKFGWKEVGAAIATNITYCLNFVIIELTCCMKESLRKTKRHVTIQSRLGTVPSLIRHSLPILKSLLVDQSVRANEALPWLPVGLLLLVAVSLLHNTLA